MAVDSVIAAVLAATAPEVVALAADQIVSEVGICLAAVAETAMPLEEAPGDTTVREPAALAAVAPPVGDRGEGAVLVAVVVEDGADSWLFRDRMTAGSTQ